MRHEIQTDRTWHIVDDTSASTSVRIDGLDALMWPVYHQARRDFVSIGSDAVVSLINERYGGDDTDFEDTIAADADAFYRLVAMSLDDFVACVRIGFVLRDGWVDRLEHDAHCWQQRRDDNAEKSAGVEAQRLITRLRGRFRMAERGRRGPGLIRPN
jgi:hypothetical protein